MKKFKTGIVIGKFLPLHKGHIALINAALKDVENLIVLVCHTKKYQIPAETRKLWIKHEFPNIEVRIVKHTERLDSTDTNVSKEWADITKKFLGFSPDVVFSSEKYGIEYAKWLNAEHVMFDKMRIKIPISATQIRENPYRNWDKLSDIVKAFYAVRVVILGAESTGTTTLAADLAKKLNTCWVPEYGRTYYESKMFTKDSYKWNESEFLHIAKMQNLIEDKLAEKCNKTLICDTDSFATSIWYTRYVGGRSKRLEALSRTQKHTLYVLTDTDIPFVQDGTRDGEHIRQWMHSYFIKRLEETRRNYIVVSGSKEKRLKETLHSIENIYKNTNMQTTP